jgi:hypothetical protein
MLISRSIADAMVGGVDGDADAPAAGELWLLTDKLMLPRVTMLLLAVEKFGAVSWDYCSFLFEFFRKQATRHGADQSCIVNGL